MSASVRGHDEVVKILLQNGASADLRSNYDSSALAMAVSAGHRDAALALLQAFKSPHSPQKHDWASLMQASLEGNLPIPEEVLLAGVSANSRPKQANGLTALSVAASFGETNAVIALLQHGADVSTTGRLGWRAINYASSSGRIEVIALLLGHGAELDSTDSDNDTTVAHAAAAGQHSTVSFLVDQGADMDSRGENGYTPLMWASLKATH